MNRIALSILLLFAIVTKVASQSLQLMASMDSLLCVPSKKSFSGIVMVAKNGEAIYTKTYGYANRDKKIALKNNNQFIIGSISKQITAVIVLQEMDRGHLNLNDPIKKYLPQLKRSWVDTVTINHLLLHMHGIEWLNKPLAYAPGSAFNYGLANTGYNLLSQLVEKTSGKSFATLSAELFKACGMDNSFHPDIKQYKQLVKGYTEQENGEIKFEKASFQNAPAAGGFISTAVDLVKWNECLHGGKLLKPETYMLMITKQPGAIRQHQLFGETFYGYGITVDKKGGMLMLGQTGFAPGFASMDFYFPQTQTSIIVLENIAYNTNDLKKTFYYHLQLLKLVRANLLK
jgi:D-alanyl-D-alanine carboxypeptidase